MAQPIYFCSGAARSALVGDTLCAPVINRELLRELGLDTVFADVDAKSIGAADFNKAGPDGKLGFLFWYCTPNGALPTITQYKPNLQTWHQCSDRLWLGTLNGQEPRAEDLARKRVIKGYAFDASCGVLTIPILRRCFDDSSNLPSGVHKDPMTGNLARPIRREYRHLWEASEDICPWFFMKDGGEPTPPEMIQAYEFALRALNLNYRIGEHEQKTLGLFEFDNVMTICACAVDYYGAIQLAEAQKKTISSSDAPSSTLGQEAV